MARKLHFDLFAILEWTATIAFLCALLVGAGTRASWTCDFTTLPADDSKLLSWLKTESHDNVTVTRENNSITLSTRSGIRSWKPSIFGLLPKPPWPELGYGATRGTRGSTQWTMFSASPYVWLAGLGILIALGLIRRRYVKPMHASAPGEADQ